MDSTSRDILTDQSIDMEDTWFEMSPYQIAQHEQISAYYNQIRSEYHALHSALWFGHAIVPNKLVER